MKKLHLLLLLTISLLSACSKEPDACFEHEVIGNKVNFDATCSMNANSYLWDFGDSGSSVIATPLHSYSASGDYAVTLTVETKQGKSASRSINITIGTSGSQPINTNFDGVYSAMETHNTGVRAYSVVVAPSSTRTSEATFNGLWYTGGAVTAVIDIGATSFTIHRQTLQSGKDIVSTSGTINADGTRINLLYQVLETTSSNLVDECTLVLSR